MQFLRTLFWVVFAVIAAVFSLRNWTPVTVRLFGGMEADAKLPVLVFGAFLIGFLPTYFIHRATRWQLKRRLDSAERSLAELRGPATVTPAGAADPFAPPTLPTTPVTPDPGPSLVVPPSTT